MNFFLIFLLSFINFAENDANSLAKLDSRVINGEDAYIEDFKFIVYLDIGYGFFACAGIIVQEQYIITAAHCAELCLANLCSCSIRAGATNYNNGNKYYVADAKIHPNYDRTTNAYDGAVLKLCKKLVFSSTIGSIPFSSPTSLEIPAGSESVIVGWGETETGKTSDTLKYAIVNIVDINSCNASYDGGITDSMICAAAPGKDTCYGDSGGPLIVQNTVVGIVSFGEGCAQEGYPGVYAKTKALSQWFNNIIQVMKASSILVLDNVCTKCVT